MAKLFECKLEVGTLYPVREAENVEQFIQDLIEEYNDQCFGLFDIDKSMIKDAMFSSET